MKKADSFFNFYLPDFIDIQLYESSNPTGMDYLLFGIYIIILKKFFIKSKKALKNQGSRKDTFKSNRLRGTQTANSLDLRSVCLSAYFLDGRQDEILCMSKV